MGEPKPFNELLDHGLLWLINRTVFHPRGYALSIHLDDDGVATGWDLLGDGTEPWGYDPSVPEDGKFKDVEAFLASVRGEPTDE